MKTMRSKIEKYGRISMFQELLLLHQRPSNMLVILELIAYIYPLNLVVYIYYFIDLEILKSKFDPGEIH